MNTNGQAEKETKEQEERGDTRRDNKFKESQLERQKREERQRGGVEERAERVEQEQPSSLDEPLLTFLVIEWWWNTHQSLNPACTTRLNGPG